MHGTRKSKTSVRGGTTDLVSVNDANIAPGLGAVSTSNIIAGGRTRKGARANDDRSVETEKGSAGDKPAKPGGKAHGDKSGNEDAVDSANYHNNSIAKAGGKARGNQSGNDDAVVRQ